MLFRKLEGKIAGPFYWSQVQCVHISRFRATPKKSHPGKRCLIDLSYPKGGSVNDGINPEWCSLSYAFTDNAADMILQLGRGTCLANVDIQSAYWIVPIHPTDRWLLGVMWKDKVYTDMALPFELWSAPNVFNTIADALEWILHSKSIKYSLHYLDDFLFLVIPDCGECDDALQLALSICA